MDENVNTSGNISNIANDLKGRPIPDAPIQAKIPEPIGPGERINTNFHIIDTKRIDVSGAFIIAVDSMGNQVVIQTDEKGKASASVSPGRANITIKAGGYEDFNENSVNLSGNTINTFVLKHDTFSKTSLLYIFALMVPFILLLFATLVKWTNPGDYWWYPCTSVAGWIIAFVILISLAYISDDYNIYFLDPRLKVSLFVPIAAFLGATSHITMSKLNNIRRKLSTEEEWSYVYVGYGRRLLMAPYVAIIALFTIKEVVQVENLWAVLFFAYFVGLYTKSIEGTLYEIGKKFLTEKQKNEANEKDMKARKIVRWLGVSTSIAARFEAAGIKDIEDLVAIQNQDTEIKKIADKAGIDETYFKSLMDKAKDLNKNMEEMKRELGLNHQEITELADKEIYSKADLIKFDKKHPGEIVEKYSIDEEKLKNFINPSDGELQD
ncbi:MAG: hypothetical protein FIB08_08840 [Candidatus Methanoperedens sp.]|nr:hypothetical protein [Candidatus Methanoperedens sp.]